MISSALVWIMSLDARSVGNLPALVRPGPNRRGICLMSVSDARKKSYFFASFFTSFLFLLSFLRSSTLMYSHPSSLHVSTCLAFASTQNDMLGRGIAGSLKLPLKRLSFLGS